MASNKQPERKKKTKEEVKRTKNKLAARQVDTSRKQIADLRKDRHNIQSSLAEVVVEVRTMHSIINSEEVIKRVPEDVRNRCKESIESFKKEIDDKKDMVKAAIEELKEMEDQVLSKKTAIDDVVLPYNLSAAPLMDTVIAITQKGADTLMSCTEELSKFTDIDDEKPNEVKQ